MVKNCVACAEEIKEEAKLCKHCNTIQDDPKFNPSREERLVQSSKKTTRRTVPASICPVCDQSDCVAKVSAIVDSGTSSSVNLGMLSQLGNLSNTFGSVSIGTNSSSLASRLTIEIPEAVFNYKFVDFALGVFFAFGLLIGLVFKTGSPLDSGPFNIIFTSIGSLFIGPIIGIFIALTRKRNQEQNIAPLQEALVDASEELRQARYCSRDDVVFDAKFCGSPEEFIENVIERQ
jgi:hypothetical protein